MRQPYRSQGRGYSPYSQSSDNLTYTETIPEYFGKPVEDYANVSQQLYQRGEQNRLAYEELALTAEMDMQNIRSEFKDDADGEAIVNSISNIENKVNSFVEGGNFHSAARVISNVYRDYVTDEKRQAAIGARQAQVANNQSIMEMEGWSVEDKQKAIARSNSSAYNKSIEEGGFIGYTPPEYVDINEMINKYMGDWNSYKDSMEEGMWQTSTADGQNIIGLQPYLQKITQSTTGISEDKVIAGITGLIASDPKAMAYLSAKYELDNLDPETGQIRQITENDLINYFPSPKKDDKGKEVDRLTRLNKSRLAVKGAFNERKELYNELDMEVSNEQIMQEIHKEHYMNQQIMSYVGGQGIKFTHSQRKITNDLMQDYVYKARQDRENEKAEAVTVAIRKFGAEGYDIDPRGLSNMIKEQEGDIMSIRSQLDKATPGTEEYSSLESQLYQAESTKNTTSVILNDLYKSASFNDVIKTLKYNKQIGTSTDRDITNNADLDKIYKLYTTNQSELEEYLYTFLETQDTPFGRVSHLTKEQQINKAVDDYIYQLDNAFVKNVDSSKTGWHKNMLAINTEGLLSSQLADTFASDIINRPEFSFTTIDGKSSADTKFMEDVEGATEVKVSYLTDTINGNLLMAVTWKNEEETLKSAIVNSNQLNGINQDLGIELMQEASSGKYKNSPNYRNAMMDVGKSIYMSFQPTYDIKGNSTGDLATVLQNLSIQSRNKGIINKDNPLVLRIPSADDIKEVPIRIHKLNDTNQEMKIEYRKADGTWKLSSKIYRNIGDIYTNLYDDLYNPNR